MSIEEESALAVEKAKSNTTIREFEKTSPLEEVSWKKNQSNNLDWCCMCTRDGETVNHLLLHCEAASPTAISLFGSSWAMPQ